MFNLYFFTFHQALLGCPNPDDPLNENAARHWKEDEDAAISQGK